MSHERPTTRGETTVALQVLPLADVAERTGRNAELVRRWCAAGRIRCHRIGRDWMIEPGELARIQAMPTRGKRKERTMDVRGLDVLAPGLVAALHDCLEPDETVHEVIAGIEDSALIATDTRIFVARDGVLVTEPEHGEVAVWPLDWPRRIQLTAGAAAGALVLTSQDPTDRPLVLVLAKPHLQRAEAATASLRSRLVANGNFTDDPEEPDDKG